MMRSAEDLLQELTALDESHRIEAKRARQIDRSVMETVCAFANEPGLGGGYLLLGVRRDSQDLFNNAYWVEGIDDPDQLQSDLASQCASVFNQPPMMRIDYLRVPGRQWVEDPDHRFDTLEIRAPLLTAIRRATNTVRDELIQSFALPEGALAREDEPTLPLRVIREAIVNAVMHRSYRIHGAIQIIRYANRLEIRNPGHSIKAEEQLGEPGSETRNPRIAAVLHEVNIAETKGSGIRAMRELMLAQDLLPPTFESSRRPDQFVATFLFHHFLGPDDLAWLRNLTREPISDEESRALVFVRELGAIDNAAYRTINRTDTLSASGHLRRLRDLELLEMKGAGNRTYYAPGAMFVAGSQPGQSAGGAGNPHHPTPDTHQLRSNTHQVAADTHQRLAALPAPLKARVPSAGTKPRRETLRVLIRDLCAWRAFSARELAELLGGRDHKHLVRELLSPMVHDGLLAYTVPEMENHPDQRYTRAAPSTEGTGTPP
jgi:ATP-dependent DNA helicase RecG